MTAFALTSRQKQSLHEQALGRFLHYCTYGGARSTKTFRNLYVVIARAIRGPFGRHAVVRKAQKHVRASVWADTFPKVMRLAFPQLKEGIHYKLNRTELVCTFWNGAEIWFLGLDDAERAERILGMEFVSLFLNEISQLSWRSVVMLHTRLAQRVIRDDGREMPLMALYDCNPPRSKKHWSNRLFLEKLDPESLKPLRNPDDYGATQMNPVDNPHLPDVTKSMLKNMAPADRKRFWDGVFGDGGAGLWDYSTFRYVEYSADTRRPNLPDMRRIIVAVDPPGGVPGATQEQQAKLAEAGIVVCGLGTDGRGYVLRDVSMRGKTEQWAQAAVNAYRRYGADAIVAEVNQGGDMVRAAVHAVDNNVPFHAVRASRGKVKRASPVASLYGQGKVSHMLGMDDLENQMLEFTEDFDPAEAGYSPDRVDALVWGITELMLQPGNSTGFAEITGT